MTNDQNMMIAMPIGAMINVNDWAWDPVGAIFAVMHPMSIFIEGAVVFTQAFIYKIGLGLSHRNRTVRNNILVTQITLRHVVHNLVPGMKLHHT